MASTLAYVAAGAIALLGVAHVLPTRRVVAGFESLSTDNRRVLVREWLAEAVTMCGIAAVVGTATHSGSGLDWLCRTMAGLLVALAGLTAFTGARTVVVFFKSATDCCWGQPLSCSAGSRKSDLKSVRSLDRRRSRPPETL
jgi:hypothetical protein